MNVSRSGVEFIGCSCRVTGPRSVERADVRARVVAAGHRAGARERAVEVERRLELGATGAALVRGPELLQRVDDRVAGGVAEPAVARRLQQPGEPLIRARSLREPFAARACPSRCSSSVVPTRQGVQKPQLSWAKKCAKLRATSNMSRYSSKTMNAPAVGRSSKAMRRSNSRRRRSMPDGPPTCTACVSLGAAVREHLPHRDAERVLVDAGPRAVAGDATAAWCRSTARVPIAREPPAAVHGDQRGRSRTSRRC